MIDNPTGRQNEGHAADAGAHASESGHRSNHLVACRPVAPSPIKASSSPVIDFAGYDRGCGRLDPLNAKLYFSHRIAPYGL